MQVKTKRAATGRRAGNDTAARIVLAARELLMTEGYAQFSMRNVAARAGLHLANVQYYYKTREALVKALLDDTGERYRSSYEELRARGPTDREARFKAVVGQSPLDFLTQHRMHQAGHLIDSSLSIAEVASRVGYDSEISFARAFKRVMGQTPGAFKRRRSLAITQD